MLKIGDGVTRTCRGFSRREILQVGGLGFLGLSLADWFGARPSVAAAADNTSREQACIFIFLSGGPSHFETFDPKPMAPLEIRGPYSSIPTSVPGIRISELLPQIARRMDKCALIRSMVTRDMHAGTYVVSGGHRSNASLGAVLQQLKGATGSGMPPFVQIGPSGYLPGGGSLGSVFNPLIVNDPSRTVSLPEFTLTASVDANRFQDRRELLRAVDDVRAALHDNASVTDMDVNYRRAAELLTSDRVRTAFDVTKESDELRTRYGASIFGQSCLLARRLVEAGTRFIQVNWYGEPAWHGWDVHGADLPGLVRMESPLCPRLDQGVSALLDDLHQRGLLASTLVIVMGEFGRTPRINQYGGRDHWPQCGSVLLAGCGIPGGAVIGASDNDGALPATRPVNIPELAATVYRLMGINTNTDLRIRPFIGDAAPMAELI
jgi:Protein of unknown function (DUF1501)